MNEITTYALDPENAQNNFNLAKWYYDQGHYAPAFTFFLRCADRTDDDLLGYESLILAFHCSDISGGRNHTSQTLLEHAICLLPERPEAHYFVCKMYEKYGDHHHVSYRTAHLALKICDFDLPPLPVDVGYPGKYAFIFQKAYMGYNWGKGTECRLLYRDLIENYDMNDDYIKSVEDNLNTIGCGPVEVAYKSYDKSKNLRYKFDGYEKIEQNYSQVYQDMFVLSMLNGKTDGTYVEVGSGDPFWGNNTALLEKDFNWKGVGIEIDDKVVSKYTKLRNNKVYCKDALEINYEKFLLENFDGNVIDYLQLDCDPTKNTFQILMSIPFDKYRFRVITYEHDHFIDISQTYRDKSRRYLQLMGYELIANDIGPTDWFSFEDWWVHPDFVDKDNIKQMKNISKGVNNVQRYMNHE